MSEATVDRGGAPVFRRRRWSRAIRGIVWLVGCVVVALVVVAILVVVQGTYVEVRRADAILVLPDSCATPSVSVPCGAERLDYAFDLYRRGYASHIVLFDQQVAAAERAYMLDKGFPDQYLLVEDQAASRPAQMRRIAQLAREQGISSLLIVGAPPEMLRALKMARDLDVAAYSTPLPGLPAFVPLAVAQETLAYWRYVLFDL